jgi:hypothetical protein
LPGGDINARYISGICGPRHSYGEREIIHAQSFADGGRFGKRKEVNLIFNARHIFARAYRTLFDSSGAALNFW